MEKKIPLNRPQIDFEVKSLFSHSESENLIPYRNYVKFQKAFMITKKGVERTYPNLRLTLSDVPEEICCSEIGFNSYSKYEYYFTFHQILLSYKSDVTVTPEMIDLILRRFKHLGVDLDTKFSLNVTGITSINHILGITNKNNEDGDWKPYPLSCGIKTNVIRKYSQHYINELRSEQFLTYLDHIPTEKTSLINTTMSYLKKLVGI